MLDVASFIVLQVTLFLAPLFFLPSLSVPFQAGKAAFMIYGVVAALVLWLAARLKDGVFNIPKSWWYASSGVLALAYGLAAIFSVNHAASYAGQGFELGTLAFFLVSLVVFALVPLVTKTKEQIFLSYGAILGSFFVLALFHVLRFFFGADFLSFGLFGSTTSNLIGSWNDVGIFLGLAALVSLVTLERAKLTTVVKTLVVITFVVSLGLLVIVNFASVWTLLAIISLVFFIYELSFGKRDRGEAHGRSRVPFYALIVLVLSVFFAFGGSRLGAAASNSLGLSQVEVRPSWGATWDVTKAAIAENPLFGAGPNRFSSEWLLNKPDGINGTLFWNTDFAYGIGFLPSIAVTAGIIGALAALAFLVLFAWTAIKGLFRSGSSPFSRYLVLSSLFGSLYLWIFAVIYVPSAPIWLLTLFMSGLFIAALREDKAMEFRTVAVLEKPTANFVSVLLIILALIGSLAFAYFVTVKLVANTYFQKGIIALNANDLDKGQDYVAKAYDLAPSDTYTQYLAEIYLARINALFSKTDISKADAQSQFQTLLSGAIQAAQAGVAFDGSNYSNYVTLGRVFEAVVPLKIDGAYDSAKKAYEDALALNPQSPEIYLLLARLEIAHEDVAAAKADIAKSLEKKADYAEAIYLLSQIQISEGNVPAAIKSVESVATLSPSDSGIFFQLGLLYYDQKQYDNAVLAFNRAVTLNPQYANAKYFLGLALYQTGDKDGALKQFQDLAVSNPDSAEVKAIIANLMAGKAPLTGVSQPKDQLPVAETSTKEDK